MMIQQQFIIITTLMMCRCEEKATLQQNMDSINTPIQMRLIRELGLQPYFLNKFVFRRQSKTYTIQKVKGVNTVFYERQPFKQPLFYSSKVEILSSGNHSIPVIKLSPLRTTKEKLPCIVYAHGNSSDLGSALKFIAGISGKFQAEYVAFDYTGYGQSRKNNIGEEIICRDLEIVLAWLGKPLNEVILWGFSLGCFPVAVIGARFSFKSVVLQCPIGSLSCMFYQSYDTKIKFKQDNFATIDHITKVNGKVLLMHSMADEIIPISQAHLLFQKYTGQNGEKMITFIEVQKLGHNDLHKYLTSTTANDLQKEVLYFLKTNQKEMNRQVFNQIDVPFPEILKEISTQISLDSIKDAETEIRSEITISERRSVVNTGWLCFQN